ncbi:hypothetical protein [Coleofasciculus sp. FACHB-129]|uniref:hypothetical protein n=1 Tax=Cyanophyceae TaxID=3028117 RepID=UPI001684A3A1|nr:hypothetical protein [Coleofasciculus sp. FACHB-129]MBD1898034.1 hypothetical protein [Coleofasciculus sp. FACHB-129]
MFSQFRVRYPLGSLTTELLTIHEGKYVVKAAVQVEGVILATGLAAAGEIELAEDKATARALNCLGIPAGSSSHNTPVTQSDAQITQTVAVEVPVGAIANPRRETVIPSESPPQPNPNRMYSDPVSFNDMAGMSFSDRGQKEAASPPPVVLSNQDVPFAEEYSPAHTELYGDDAAIETPEEISGGLFSSQHNQPMTSSPGYHASEEVIQPSPMDMTIGSTSSAAEEMDLSEAMARTTVEIKRLRWTAEQGKDYLKRTYGKRGRSELNQEQLLDFLRYLESLPTPEK